MAVIKKEEIVSPNKRSIAMNYTSFTPTYTNTVYFQFRRIFEKREGSILTYRLIVAIIVG